MYLDTKEQLEISEEHPPVFIWNDDLESIPMDGEQITLEFTKNDTIYIGPSN